MYNRELIVFALFLLVQISLSAKVPPSKPVVPPAVHASNNVFEDMSQRATEFVSLVGKQVNQLAQVKDAVELQAILKSNTDEFVAKVTELSKNFQDQIKSTASDSNSAVGQAIVKFDQTILDLQKQHPEITHRAKEIQDNLQQGFKNVLAEADKISKTFAENAKDVQDDIAKLAKKAYDQVLNTAESLHKQLHEYANKPVSKTK